MASTEAGRIAYAARRGDRCAGCDRALLAGEPVQLRELAHLDAGDVPLWSDPDEGLVDLARSVFVGMFDDEAPGHTTHRHQEVHA